MEENSNIKKHPNLPTNYVTLLQLQERWVKEKQRKQKEEEEEEEASKQKQNEKQEENPESEQKPEDAQPIGRISKKSYHRRSRNFKVVDAGAHRKETNAAVSASVLVEENGNESGVNKEVRREGLRNKKKKGRNKKKKKENNGEEARAQNKAKVEEEQGQGQGQEETGRDAHAPPVIPARRSERKSETRVEYRPKINDVVETGDATVEEMDEKFGDLSIGKASDRSSLQRQNRVINHRDRGYRGCNSGVYRGNGHYSHRGGYEIGAHRGNGHYMGGNWKFNRGNGQGTGGYRRFNGSRESNVGRGGMVWVRKEEGADGGASGDVAENQSSGGSFRELE